MMTKESKVLENIVEVDDLDEIMADAEEVKDAKPKKKSGKVQSEATWREPKRLPNGRWTCQHSCADEAKDCKHKCCREGVAKRPIKPKQPIAKRQKVDSQSNLDFSGTSKTRKIDGQDSNDTMLPNTKKKEANAGTKHQARDSSNTTSKRSNTTTQRSEDPEIDLRHELEQSRKILEAFETEDFDWTAVDEIAHRFDDIPVMDKETHNAVQNDNSAKSTSFHRHELPSSTKKQHQIGRAHV